jgi:hypothetical protein
MNNIMMANGKRDGILAASRYREAHAFAALFQLRRSTNRNKNITHRLLAYQMREWPTTSGIVIQPTMQLHG